MALPLTSQPSTIHLDYGADSAPFDFDGLHVCLRGLCMRTRWRFDPGTEIAVNFQLDDGTGAVPRLLKTEGVVAACEEDAPALGSCDAGSCYRLTLVFLEVTEDIRALVRALSHGGTSQASWEAEEVLEDE